MYLKCLQYDSTFSWKDLIQKDLPNIFIPLRIGSHRIICSNHAREKGIHKFYEGIILIFRVSHNCAYILIYLEKERIQWLSKHTNIYQRA